MPYKKDRFCKPLKDRRGIWYDKPTDTHLFSEEDVLGAVKFYMQYKDDYVGLLKKDHPEVYKEFERFVEKLNKEDFSKKGVYLPPDAISLDAHDWFLKWCFSDVLEEM